MMKIKDDNTNRLQQSKFFRSHPNRQETKRITGCIGREVRPDIWVSILRFSIFSLVFICSWRCRSSCKKHTHSRLFRPILNKLRWENTRQLQITNKCYCNKNQHHDNVLLLFLDSLKSYKDIMIIIISYSSV